MMELFAILLAITIPVVLVWVLSPNWKEEKARRQFLNDQWTESTGLADFLSGRAASRLRDRTHV